MRSIQVAASATALVLFGSAGVAAAAPPKDYCAELKGANTGQACKIQMADPGYNVDISFPVNYPDEKSVADFITKERDDFLNAAKSSAPRDQPYQLTISSTNYGSAIPPRGTEAVVFKVVENTGAPKTTFKSFNWDQTYRKAIVWTAASDDKNNTPLWRVDDPLQTVAPIVQSELQKQAAPPANPAQTPRGTSRRPHLPRTRRRRPRRWPSRRPPPTTPPTTRISRSPTTE
ncbi:immunogenic protein MPT64 [Mycobacterium intracellulare 1956]|uniref:Immunogenic protein MPT64 n=1 Tax=Mycobacterium intracellulare 1956 TaxID=1299331 RepID=X8CLM7_MYCIT|nr:immunogenic protein MPT64 [Mycobacterium intracellulare 1956]